MFHTASVSLFLTTVAVAETHVVECIDMSFVPNVVNVVPGDVIRWEYVSGFPHTATSGSPCLYDGLFHGSVASFNPVYEWKVPNDVPEDIPYMCIPHCNDGMTGIIYVDLGHTTWTVDDDGKADFDSIQAAVDVASDGDEIIVMPGIYIGTDNQVVDMLGKAVWLHGINGSDATIIDGEDVRRGIRCDSGESNKTIIEGFTITACRADNGGGLYIRDGSPTISNCTIIANTANSDGGGLLVREGSPAITNCAIAGNTAGDDGGGIFIREGSPAITSCTIEDNVTGGDGGGIFCRDKANAEISDCTIEGNVAGEVGGGLASDDSMPAIGESRFCENVPSDIDGPWSNTGGNEFPGSCSEACPGDIDGSGVVDVTDLLAVIGAWGECEGQNVHVVNQIGLTFYPREITVARGDLIRWVWGGGSHTVTSGTLPCDADGLFDGPLAGGAPIFEWSVPSSTPGFIEYFCEPHCFDDMNGGISVTGEGYAFGGGCPEDIDGSGTVDVSDLLAVIAAWGDCP